MHWSHFINSLKKMKESGHFLDSTAPRSPCNRCQRALAKPRTDFGVQKGSRRHSRSVALGPARTSSDLFGSESSESKLISLIRSYKLRD